MWLSLLEREFNSCEVQAMFWKDKNVLVTCRAGFIGSHVVNKLIELGANVTIADNLSIGSLNNVFQVWTKH